jgi:hypothetical protein
VIRTRKESNDRHFDAKTKFPRSTPSRVLSEIHPGAEMGQSYLLQQALAPWDGHRGAMQARTPRPH